MPAIHTYLVTRTQYVEVRAENPNDALQVAALTFAKHGEVSREDLLELEAQTGVRGAPTGPLTTQKIEIELTS